MPVWLPRPANYGQDVENVEKMASLDPKKTKSMPCFCGKLGICGFRFVFRTILETLTSKLCIIAMYLGGFVPLNNYIYIYIIIYHCISIYHCIYQLILA